MLVAIPVLLGSLARIPMGILTDRFGGRAIFSILMAAVAIPVWMVPQQATYSGLLTVAFLLGLAGSSFAIGVGYVSRWTPPERQGSALGVYGLGNIGQSAAVFLGPVLAARVGMASVYHGVAVLLVVWAVSLRAAGAQCSAARRRPQRKGLGAMLEVLTREKLSWLLAAFYFLTFGGFVAFSIYLPTLLQGRIPSDAGRRRISNRRLRRAGHAAAPAGRLALRPHRRRARAVRGLPRRRAVRAAAGMAVDDSLHRRRARLRGAARAWATARCSNWCRNIFPTQTGTVTGLVGAMGGLGGFFPPLLLGLLPQPHRRDLAGLRCCWPRTALAALVGQSPRLRAAAAGPRPRAARRSSPHRRPRARRRLGHAVDRAAGRRDRGRLAQSAELRSGAGDLHLRRRLRDLGRRLPLQRLAGKAADARLLGSRLGTVPAAGAFCAACAAWSRSPRRIWSAQRFIAHRSRLRWWMHQCLFWGCLLAVAITFPLVFGWIHFRTAARRPIDLRHLPVRFPGGHRSACTR